MQIEQAVDGITRHYGPAEWIPVMATRAPAQTIGLALMVQGILEEGPLAQKIKHFMAAHGIIDIKMRMLKIRELKKITGLPEDYVLLGNKGDQKKFIGNAVPPVIPRRIFETLFREINGLPEEGEQTEGLPLFKCAE